MTYQNINKAKLSDSPGVYIFKKAKKILYIGKATSIKDRVKSYFSNDLFTRRGPLLVEMIKQANKVESIQTDSVLEALILEAKLIKKYKPKFNTKEKDNKSFNYVVITKEDWPRVLIMRGRDIGGENQKKTQISNSFRSIFGPYTNSTQLKEAIKIVRKLFPFRDKCVPMSGRPCFNYQLNLCPGICIGVITKKEYQKNIRNIQLFFNGQKKQIINNLTKQMKLFVLKTEYEKAQEVRNKIFALNHIQDIALIKEESPDSALEFRLEAFDVAHLAGSNNVGVMVVMENGELKKADYRKFKINKSRGNDLAAVEEILVRRLAHHEWPKPNLFVVDGGLTQLNVAKKVIGDWSVVAVTKDDRHKPMAIIGSKQCIKKYQKEILLLNNEAHRFAIKYHRSKRTFL